MSESVTTTDLFGNPISIKFGDPLPKGAQKKRKRDDSLRGNAAPIGSGPKGETCKTCIHAYCSKYAKRYWKCRLVKPTHSPKTDIRLKWAACSRWEPKSPDEKDK